MTNTYDDAIKKLNLGKLGNQIDDYEGDIDTAFSDIAEANVDVYYDDLFEWAKDHISEVDQEIAMGGKSIIDIIQSAQYKVFCDDLYNHKDDILLYYAYNYMQKKAIDLDEEKLKKIENFVTTFAAFYHLEGIESYCDHLNTK